MDANYQTEINEEWRAIPGYEGLYEVSNSGSVRSVKRLMALSPARGYLTVELWKNKEGRRFTVHRLVMMAFTGPRPDGLQINHLNGVKTDNRWVNLEYCTASENKKHACRTGLQKNFGIHHSQHKLVDSDVRLIRNMISEGIPQNQIAAHFKVNQGTISFIKTGRLWAHVK